MIKVILSLCLGIIVGYIFRKRSEIGAVSKFIFPIVLLLLFSIGISIGMNDELLSNLYNLSTEALIITLLALAGTIVGSMLLWHAILKNKI